jgi:hypothetical protein
MAAARNWPGIAPRLLPVLVPEQSEAPEPECECRQTDVDLFDARGCEFHDPDSRWNVAQRGITDIQRVERYEAASAADESCPF